MSRNFNPHNMTLIQRHFLRVGLSRPRTRDAGDNGFCESLGDVRSTQSDRVRTADISSAT